MNILILAPAALLVMLAAAWLLGRRLGGPDPGRHAAEPVPAVVPYTRQRWPVKAVIGAPPWPPLDEWTLDELGELRAQDVADPPAPGGPNPADYPPPDPPAAPEPEPAPDPGPVPPPDEPADPAPLSAPTPDAAPRPDEDPGDPPADPPAPDDPDPAGPASAWPVIVEHEPAGVPLMFGLPQLRIGLAMIDADIALWCAQVRGDLATWGRAA